MSAPVEAALRDLYTIHGRLDPKDVVDEARDPQSPLHKSFTWNNDDAAEQWRLQQARQLIRSIRIERVVTEEEAPRLVRAYVHDPEADGYLATEDVARMPDVRDRVLADMRADLERLRTKWRLYEETFLSIAGEVLAAEVAGEATPAK
jgi:hypothetical protein